MHQGFSDSDFDRLAIPFYFSHKQGALYRGDAKGCKVLLVGILREPPFGFLFDKECRQLILHDLEEKVEILADQSVIFSQLVAQGSKGTTTSHVESFLQLDMGLEPLF
jgi:hypothetical protein